MEKKKVKRKLKFKGVLLLYSIVLSVVMVVFLIHVGDSLIKYEKNNTDKYILSTLKKVCNNGKCDIEGLTSMEKSEFDNDKPIEESIEKLLQNADLKYEQTLDSSEDNPVFDILANDEVILQISLKSKKKINRLGLLSFYVWESGSVISKLENGFYTYKITAPNTYKVYVNDKELTSNYKIDGEQNEAFTEMAKYVTIPYEVTYEIKNLYSEPDVKIKDASGNEVSYEKSGYQIKKTIEVTKIADKGSALEKIKQAPNIMKIAEDWSLFLTQDLVNGNLNSYHKIKEYLVPNSELDKYAHSWATGIDITFTSKHTLENPPFTNERLENFEIYNDNAFSCEVYLEKNMVVRGNKHQDVMHDRLYFVKLNNEWKLVNMQAITEGNLDNGGNSSSNTGV